MKKVLFVIGTRPEAIKMAPLIKRLAKNEQLSVSVCATAQHRGMLDQVLNLFDIKPDFDLNVMRPNQDLFDVTSLVLLGVRDVISKYQPDVMLVQGDTTTSFAAALAGFYANIKIGHVEAGLRTGNLREPFPEEGNRLLTSRLADWHFCPTAINRNNLLHENIPDSKICITGNTVIDALLWVRDQTLQKPQILSNDIWGTAGPYINAESPIILITGHRRENFGSGFRNICTAIAALAEKHSDWQFIYPVHLNPNVQGPVFELLSNTTNVHLIPPLDYAPFVFLMNKARIILTDSGGVQEEGPALGKPVIVMRDVTERPEAVTSGTALLVGTDSDKIVKETESLMLDETRYNSMARAHNPYGDGNASERISNFLDSVFLN